MWAIPDGGGARNTKQQRQTTRSSKDKQHETAKTNNTKQQRQTTRNSTDFKYQRDCCGIKGGSSGSEGRGSSRGRGGQQFEVKALLGAHSIQLVCPRGHNGWRVGEALPEARCKQAAHGTTANNANAQVCHVLLLCSAAHTTSAGSRTGRRNSTSSTSRRMRSGTIKRVARRARRVLPRRGQHMQGSTV